MDKFTHLGNSVSSNESNIKMRLGKAWTTIDRLLIIWKSDLSDKLKRNFFQATVEMYNMDANKTCWEKTRRELHKNATSYIGKIQEATSYETTAVWSLTSYL